MIIGFTGLMQSGKTTASDKLIEQGFTKINFKDALVEELKTKFPDLLDLLVFDNGVIHELKTLMICSKQNPTDAGVDAELWH